MPKTITNSSIYDTINGTNINFNNASFGNLSNNYGINGNNIGNNTIGLNTIFTGSYDPFIANDPTTIGTLYNSTTSNIFMNGFTTLTDGNYKMKTNIISKFYFNYKFVYETG